MYNFFKMRDYVIFIFAWNYIRNSSKGWNLLVKEERYYIRLFKDIKVIDVK